MICSATGKRKRKKKIAFRPKICVDGSKKAKFASVDANFFPLNRSNRGHHFEVLAASDSSRLCFVKICPQIPNMALDILRFGLDLGTEANLVRLLAISLETNRYHELMRRKRKNLLALREILNYKPKPGGSKPGKASNKPRGREAGAEQIRLDYFVVMSRP